ncbi:hypothetical protein KI387_010525, partial [Taxus chinensis]
MHLRITVSAILMQNNSKDIESPIDFMSSPLKPHELNMSQLEKHAFSVVKVVKNFHYYILNSHIVVLVPETAI